MPIIKNMTCKHQLLYRGLLRGVSGLCRGGLLAALLFFTFCDLGEAPQNTEPRVPKAEYSAKEPGEWERYAKDHPPRVEVSLKGRADNIGVYVILEDYSESHYIESVGILDSQGDVVVSQRFGRGQGKSFNARFSLDPLQEGYKIYARCSQHDLWVTPIEEARFIDGNSPF